MQVSPAFRISPLPREITSWLEYWVQHRPDTTVTTTTHKKTDTHFNHWLKFLSACELDDNIFLDEYSHHDRITLLGAYAHSIREKAYSVTQRKRGRESR